MNGPLSYKAQQSTVNIKRKNHPLFIFAHEYGGRFFVCCFASVKITKFNIGRTLGDLRNISTISIIWHLLHLYILQYQGCFDPKQSKKRPKNCPKKHPKKTFQIFILVQILGSFWTSLPILQLDTSLMDVSQRRGRILSSYKLYSPHRKYYSAKPIMILVALVSLSCCNI